VGTAVVKLLLDVHVLVWMVTGDKRLSQIVRSAILNINHSLHFSAVSAWEYSSLRAKQRLPIDTLLDDLLLQCNIQLEDFPATTHEYAANLPTIHLDPFDRMMIAHALVGGFTLVSADADIKKYAVPTLW
jgi:PIN domain nuclease of toxin-antitoxin system